MATASGIARDNGIAQPTQEFSQSNTYRESESPRETSYVIPRPVSRGSKNIRPNESRHETSPPPDLRQHPVYREQHEEVSGSNLAQAHPTHREVQTSSPDSKLIQVRGDLIAKELSIILADARDLDRRLLKIAKVLQDQERALNEREGKLDKREAKINEREGWLNMREEKMRKRELVAQHREAKIIEREVELGLSYSTPEPETRSPSASPKLTFAAGEQALKDLWQRQPNKNEQSSASNSTKGNGTVVSSSNEPEEDKIERVGGNSISNNAPTEPAREETRKVSEVSTETSPSSPATPQSRQRKSHRMPFSPRTPPPAYQSPATTSKSSKSEEEKAGSRPTGFWAAAASKIASMFMPELSDKNNIYRSPSGKAAVARTGTAEQGVELFRASQRRQQQRLLSRSSLSTPRTIYKGGRR